MSKGPRRVLEERSLITTTTSSSSTSRAWKTCKRAVRSFLRLSKRQRLGEEFHRIIGSLMSEPSLKQVTCAARKQR